MVAKGNILVAWAVSWLQYIINTTIYNGIAFYGKCGLMSEKTEVVFMSESHEKLPQSVFYSFLSEATQEALIIG